MFTLNRFVRPITMAVMILLLAMTWAMPRTHVLAQSETDLRSTADYVYGQTMRFQLRASNLGDVAGVTLFFRPHTAVDAYTVAIPIEPGAEIDVSYALDLTQTRLPPFSSVSYWWELKRADGATLRVPERTISYIDDQFSWQWISKADPEGGGVVTVQWTGEDPDVGETAFSLVLEALDRLSPYLPLDEVRPFNVFVYPASADLSSAMRLAGQDWQAGQSYPELGVLLVTAVNAATADVELNEGIGRELTDLLLYQAYGEAYTNVPQWVRNGLASMAAGGADARSSALVAEAMGNGELIPIAKLCNSFPTTGAEVSLAQAQSDALLAAISDRYGPEAVAGLIESFAAGANCDEAFSAVLMATPDDVAQTWLDQFQQADPQREQISQAIVWVLLVLAGFGLAVLVVWRAGGRRSNP